MHEPRIPEELRKLLIEFGPEELLLAPPRKGRRKPEMSQSDIRTDTSGADAMPRPPGAGQGTGEILKSQMPNPKSSSLVFTHDPPDPQPTVEIPPHLAPLPENHLPLVSKRGDKVDTLPVQWLWGQRIPLGRLVLLAGDPGVGKSFAALELAARVSTGAGWPDAPEGSRKPQNVIVFSSEDDPHDTIAPRLRHAGAALDRVLLVQGVCRPLPFRGRDFKRRFCIPEDLPSLRAAITEIWPVGLVVFDPVMAYCGKGDGFGVSSIHAMLAPLAEMAMELGVTILCTIHLRTAGGKAIYRMAGNPAFTTASRAVWGLVRDPRDRGRRLLVPVKMNLTADTDGLAFRIGDEGRVIWEPAPVKVDADRLLGESAGGRKLHQAVKWLREILSTGARRKKEVVRLADLEEIRPRTLERAKRIVGVLSRKSQEDGKQFWFWKLDESRN